MLFLYDYAPPFDAVMRAFKFGQLEVLGDRFARLAWDRYAERMVEADLVVPMPLPWTRRLARGFNQAEAIAAPLAGALGLPLDRVLRRRPTAAHSLLTRDRRQRSAASSFELARLRAKGLSKRRVLLVDDVFTSGATMKAAAFALRRAGAEVVCVLVVARTPGVGEGACPSRPRNAASAEPVRRS